MSHSLDIHKLGSVPPQAFVDARLQLHYAAQILAATADLLIHSEPDDSHTALTFDPDHNALLTQPLPQNYQLALILDTPLLMLLDSQQNILAESPLIGLTLTEALDWADHQLKRHLPSPPENNIRLRNYDMPQHPISDGDTPFTLKHQNHFTEVARYFAFAHRLIDLFTRHIPHTSPIRTWPHHFDIATLTFLDPDLSPDQSRTIGVGLSPGDHHITEPYIYITPFPTKNINKSTLPTPPHHTTWATTFLGVTITATEFLAIPHEHRIPNLIDTLTDAFILNRQLLSNL
ncbi:hypothetical protein JD969_09155 [Planctomycetota bacterium]|nr:hypothetical protein JD969_09155 [Planctomycetota bacterium]